MRIAELSAAVLAAALGIGHADRAEAAVVFDIGWTGLSGYTLEGQLTFDDSLLGTGVIDETQIDDLFIEVFLNGVSQGTAALGSFDGLLAFNLNFDTDAEQFVVGGFSDGSQGQQWNYRGSTVGFISGSGSQVVTVNGAQAGVSGIRTADSTLTAMRATTVIPLPASALLLLTGLGALVLARHRGA